MKSYQAHGLTIQSQISFPELLESSESPEIIIEYGNINYSSQKVLAEGIFRIASYYILTEDGVYLQWNDIYICQIIGGRKIKVNPDTGIEDNFLRALILGPALGILLHQRGRLVLHASAVNMDDGVVAFMGHNGIGKSTTTIAFNYKGYPIVSDDILSIELKDGIPRVIPGFPRIKLWPASLELIKQDVENYPRIHSESEKRSYFIENFSKETLPLKLVYVLEDGEKKSLENMSSQESLIELLRNSYCANIFQNTDQASNLSEYAQIVKNVSIKHLKVDRSLDTIFDVIEMVEKDLDPRM